MHNVMEFWTGHMIIKVLARLGCQEGLAVGIFWTVWLLYLTFPVLKRSSSDCTSDFCRLILPESESLRCFQALLRPGRFDRHIMIDYPTLMERIELFELYLGKLRLKGPVSTYATRLAQLTPGKSGKIIFISLFIWTSFQTIKLCKIHWKEIPKFHIIFQKLLNGDPDWFSF